MITLVERAKADTQVLRTTAASFANVVHIPLETLFNPPVMLPRPAAPPHMTLCLLKMVFPLMSWKNCRLHVSPLSSQSLSTLTHCTVADPIPTNNEPMVLDAEAPAVPPAVDSNMGMSGGHWNPLPFFYSQRSSQPPPPTLYQLHPIHQHRSQCQPAEASGNEAAHEANMKQA